MYDFNHAGIQKKKVPLVAVWLNPPPSLVGCKEKGGGWFNQTALVDSPGVDCFKFLSAWLIILS